VQASGLDNVVAVAAGNGHTLALEEDGTLWACGDNSVGQLGDGTWVSRTAPVEIAGFVGVEAVAAGDVHSAALKSDGTVWAWGHNFYGQLGNGTTSAQGAPVVARYHLRLR
jgi:alpha-tubulin suppressor-like RCC1 family protein